SGISRLAISEQSDVAAGRVIAIELEKLSATDVFAENECRIRGRRIGGAAYRILVERELGARSRRHCDLMDLACIPEPGRDEHLPPHRIPTVQGSATKVGISFAGIDNGSRYRRNTLDDQVVSGSDHIRLSDTK